MPKHLKKNEVGLIKNIVIDDNQILNFIGKGGSLCFNLCYGKSQAKYVFFFF